MPNLKITSSSKRKVNIMYFPFSALSAGVDTYFSYLVSDEIARAEKFHFPTDKNNFIIARGYLREVLASYLNIAPQAVQFNYGKYGKPEIRGEVGPAASPVLQFNLSHTKTALAIAVSFDTVVGVDIEDMSREVDIDGVAKQVFSTEEIAYINDVSDNDKRHAFYRCWTRKEAYVKALGIGIAAGDLRSLTVTHSEQPSFIISNWQVIDLPPQDQHAIALAIECEAQSAVELNFMKQS